MLYHRSRQSQARVSLVPPSARTVVGWCVSRNKCVVILISGGSLTVFISCRNSELDLA